MVIISLIDKVLSLTCLIGSGSTETEMLNFDSMLSANIQELKMVTITLKCPPCQSEELVRNGHAPNGKQKYHCNSCGRNSRDNPSSNGYSEQRREEILRAYQERSSLRGLRRTFGVSRNTVTRWIKKKTSNYQN